MNKKSIFLWVYTLTFLALFMPLFIPLYGNIQLLLPNTNTEKESLYDKNRIDNAFSDAFNSLLWKNVKKSYQEPVFYSQKPGEILEIPCANIRPDNFSRIHNFMVLGPNARCGFVTTYLNHANLNPQETVHLFFVLLPATSTSPKPDPLVFLTGGPGQPNTYLYNRIEGNINQFRYQQDYLLIDYRGSGMSVPSLSCMEELGGTYLSKEDYFDSIRSCSNKLQSQGVDLSQFNTMRIAQDIGIVLNTLGYQQANFHGVSYGTKVGLALMREYPLMVRSMVLDSVFPFEAGGFGESDYMIFNPLDFILNSCSRSPRCSPTKLRDDLKIFITRIMKLTSQNKSKSSNFVSSKNPPHDQKEDYPYIRAFSIIDTFRVLSMREFRLTEWPSELDFLNKLNDSDLVSFFLNRLNPGLPSKDLVYQYFGKDLENGIPLLALSMLKDFRGLWFSVTCQEEKITSSKQLPFYRSSYFSQKFVKTVTEKLDQRLRKTGEETCSNWGLPTFTNKEFHTPIKSKIPTLILSSGTDPYTPLDWAQQTQKHLPHSYLYVSEVGGHDVAGSDSCALFLMMKFIENPKQFLKNRKNKNNQKISSESRTCSFYQARLRYEMKSEMKKK